jgi:uncharacterized protein YukE
MTLPQDASLLSSLETQYRELNVALQRLENARTTLVPPPASFWRGTARNAYDSAISALAATVEAGCAALRSARERTGWAIEQVIARG